jgi:hypothetical protein
MFRSADYKYQEIQSSNASLEEQMYELRAQLHAIQEQSETNETVLMRRIQFLSNEMEELEAESHETVRFTATIRFNN